VPSLATAWLEWLNRHDNRHSVRLAAAVSVGAGSGTIALAWIHRVRLAAALVEVAQHTVTIAICAGVVSALVVSRERGIRAARADRSWAAALPVGVNAQRIEMWVLPLVPVAGAMLLLSSVGLLTCTVLGLAGFALRPCIAVCGALLTGAAAGAGVRLAIPASTPETPHPDSRYVPHRVTRGRRPAPSLAALGIWPIRRMFTLLQPKLAARTLLPVLLMVPLGSTAADAMIWIGAFGLAAALAAVGTSVLWVRRAAVSWLRPLPLSSSRVGQAVASRACLVMLALAAAASWLLWAGRP
jgi:hypothetical protein